jgi:hypothetical protein
MVERTEEEHRVDRRIRLRQPAGITDLSGHRPMLSCGSNMPRDNVDKMHAVAPARQPGRVYTGAAAHIKHHGRRQWQLTQQQLARAQQLEAIVGKPKQALPLVLPGIVGKQVLTLRHQTILDELSSASQIAFFRPNPGHLRLTRARPLAGGARNGTGHRSPSNGR